MTYTRFTDPRLFYRETFSALIKHEAQNSLPLGSVILGNEGGEPEGWRNPKNWYMAAVTDDGGRLLLTAVMNPPYKMTLYETDNIPNDEALSCFCGNLIKDGTEVPGVITESALAERFAEMYAKGRGIRYNIETRERIYTLTGVNPAIPETGTLRLAREEEAEWLTEWYTAFFADCGRDVPGAEEVRKAAARSAAKKLLYLLEDGGRAVAMAVTVRELVNGACIGMVYTPPALRGKGYASCCVAGVSRLLLNEGFQFVSLFTDLANPVSNSIYRRIGFQPVCDCHEIGFKPVQCE